MTPIRIWYQSYVDEAHAGPYWGRLRRYLSDVVEPGTTVDVHGITPYDSYAHALVELRCAREAVCNTVMAERQGYDAVVLGHFQDSGLLEARAAVDIPVLGLGEATMLYGCQLADHAGVVTINPRFIPMIRHQIVRYGLERRVTGVHALTFEPGQILRAYESEAQADEVADLFAAQARPLVAGGAELLIPGGGIPMLLFADRRGHAVDGAPVLNGIPIVVKMAELAVKLRRLNGLGVSRVGDYSKVPAEVVEEFLTHPKGL